MVSQSLNSKIEKNISLAQYTTWCIGGTAEFFVVPDNIEDIKNSIKFARNQNLPLFILGRGSKILIDDAGLHGITLHMANSFQNLCVDGNYIRVGAGVFLPRLARVAAQYGYTGFEFMIGIPGTVGAAVRINAGASGQQIADILEAVTLIDINGEVVRRHVSELELAYRHSTLLNSPNVVIEAVFRLENTVNRDKSMQKLHMILQKRRDKFPLSYPNAGSVFKRPKIDGYYPPGWLLETAGMKGKRIGDAQVSKKHANFIINLGNASAKDVRELIEIMREKVLEVHEIVLEREVIYLPDESSWLL